MEPVLPSHILHNKLLRRITDIEKKHHVPIILLLKKHMYDISPEVIVKISAFCITKLKTVNFTSNLYAFQDGCMK